MTGRPRKPDVVAFVRDALLDAAASVFARKGYAAATMNEIAAAAGYTAPAFYKYFSGKQDLFEALLDRLDAEIERTLSTLPQSEGMPFETCVEALCHAGFEMIDRHEQTFAILSAIHANAEAMPSRHVAQRELRRARNFQQRLVERLSSAAGGDRIGRLHVNEAALLFYAVIQALFMQWSSAKAAEGREKAGRFADRVPLAVQLFLYGACGSPAAAPSTGKPGRARAHRRR